MENGRIELGDVILDFEVYRQGNSKSTRMAAQNKNLIVILSADKVLKIYKWNVRE